MSGGNFPRKAILRYLLLTVICCLPAAVAYAAGGGDHGGDKKAELIDFGWRMLNFSILAGFLYWLAAKKIKEFFVGRHEDIKAALEQADLAKREAEEKYREYSEKLAKATEEIDGIVEMIKAQGLAEKERIIEDARKVALKIEEDTKARMEQEFKTASNALRAETVELSVRMAEELLKRSITAEDHENMVRDYLDKVVIKH